MPLASQNDIFLYQSLAAYCLSVTLTSTLESQALKAELPGSCITQPCVHGICIDTASGGHRCFCQNGYTGLNCQTNYDDCRSEPCINGGSCIDGIDDFTCLCDQGYTGLTCETDINECLSDPCLNNGLCEDLINHYICHCPLGYYGINCEHYYNICAIENDLCKNGGSCIFGCLPNFFGEKCELPTCPCERGGICVGEPEFSCLCPFGWTGKTCETPVEKHNLFFCVPDYHGKFCELQYNECIPEPSCENGATCVDDVDGYSCICPAGYLGSTCNETFACFGKECLSVHLEPSTALPSEFSFDTEMNRILSSNTRSNFPTTPLDLSTFTSNAYLHPSIVLSVTKTSEIMDNFHIMQTDFLFNANAEKHIQELPLLETNEFNLTETYLSPVLKTEMTSSAPLHPTVPSIITEDYASIFVSQNENMSISNSFSPTIFTSWNEIQKLETTFPEAKYEYHFSSSILKNSSMTLLLTTSPNSVPNEVTLAHDAIHLTSAIYSLPLHSSDAAIRRLPDYCEDLNCQNGGTPMIVNEFEESSGMRCECMCPLLYAGPICERETYLLIPQFHKSSYLKHALPSIDPEKGMDIDISFKTSAPEGTIFIYRSCYWRLFSNALY
ncbi:protein eyes shut [Caerostris extrusa]|uniref:Protein eyes shut n=1 Tax=Caerostris extrusa TaxID=172846 RepID=A0AAV4PSX1_CAEEX|nr:protein eyes shut [Caerostris extrusa]